MYYVVVLHCAEILHVYMCVSAKCGGVSPSSFLVQVHTHTDTYSTLCGPVHRGTQAAGREVRGARRGFQAEDLDFDVAAQSIV